MIKGKRKSPLMILRRKCSYLKNQQRRMKGKRILRKRRMNLKRKKKRTRKLPKKG